MQSNQGRVVSLIFTLTLAGACAAVRADEACLDFKWDVSVERTLFASAPVPLAAGKDAKSAPIVVPNRLYSLKLAPQEQVAFRAAPGKAASINPAYAGLVTLKIPAAGSYRVSVDRPFWIDVVSNGGLLSPEDFQGQHACRAPHKIVVFELGATQPFILQLSNAAADSVLISVTAAPRRKL